MKKNVLALLLTLFLVPMVSNAAIVSIVNDSTSGTGFLGSASDSGEGTVSNSHSGINGDFDDFWTVSLVPSSESFSIVSSIPKFASFNVEYRLDSASPWIAYALDTSTELVEVVTASIQDLSGFQLHIFGNANNPLGLSGSYQLTVNEVGSVSNVPVPAAVWLFGSALMGLVGVSRRKSSSVAA